MDRAQFFSLCGDIAQWLRFPLVSRTGGYRESPRKRTLLLYKSIASLCFVVYIYNQALLFLKT
jgi:hypothetical protein